MPARRLVVLHVRHHRRQPGGLDGRLDHNAGPWDASAAERLEIRDGRIVRAELFYDAEELRKAMAQRATE